VSTREFKDYVFIYVVARTGVLLSGVSETNNESIES